MLLLISCLVTKVGYKCVWQKLLHIFQPDILIQKKFMCISLTQSWLYDQWIFLYLFKKIMKYILRNIYYKDSNFMYITSLLWIYPHICTLGSYFSYYTQTKHSIRNDKIY
jgi:hypothetical protein